MENKEIWLITGVSRGLGKALAQAVLDKGDIVIGTTRDGNVDLNGDSNNLKLFGLELTDPVQIRQTVEAAYQLHERLDVIVNNAEYGLLGAIEEASDEEIKHVVKKKTSMQSPVTLINPFSVPKGREEEFLKMWHEVAQYMKDQPGFINSKFHRSLDPDARFQFINIAHWESAEAWQTAMSKVGPKAQELTQQLPFEVENSPALYRVEVEY